jgi:hypothetical protein
MTIIIAIQGAQFIAWSCNEVAAIENGFWICVHAYVVDGWTRWPILICVDKIVGFRSSNLIEVVINVLFKGEGPIKEGVSKKLLCCGENGTNRVGK